MQGEILGYRILTYTSKNEFFVIDVSKRNKKKGGPNNGQIASQNSSRMLSQEDIGISTDGVDAEEESPP